jgi:dienelactone hydrolase
MNLARPFLALLALPLALSAAELRRESIEYQQDDTVLEGQVIYDPATTSPRPGVLIVHQWKGLSDYELKRAEMLARLGYVAFCADIYGKGVRPATAQEAAPLAGSYKENRPLLRQRVQAALTQFRLHPRVQPDRIAAIGYCFGGTTVLELARSGATLQGVVSFHGGLSSPTPDDAQNIRCRVLVLHGADDPFVPPAEVMGFAEEMQKAKVDWQLFAYGGAVHSFTDWNAGNDPSRGAAYHAPTDTRSWAAMKTFFAELFP